MGEMEKRLLLFFAVTFMLVSLWPRLFPPPTPPEPPPGAEAATDVEPRAPAESDTPGTAATMDEEPEPPEEPEDEEVNARAASSERTLVIETSLYDMELTNRGGRMMSFKLREFQDSAGRPYEMVSRTAAKQLNIRLPTLEKIIPILVSGIGVIHMFYIIIFFLRIYLN